MLRYVVGVSLVTLVIVILRLITDKKIARKYHYAMWLVIPVFMLLYPFVNFSVTLPPISVFICKTETVAASDSNDNRDEYIFTNPNPLEPIDSGVNNGATVNQQEEDKINWDATAKNVSLLISNSILAVLFIYNVGFYFYVVRRRSLIKTDEQSGLKVYKLNVAKTPFLFGKCIYIGNEDEDLSIYVLCHEVCHYRQGDTIWIILRYIVFALNWYNPLIWIAFALSGIDCELACDEKVLEVLGSEAASSYGKMLLKLANTHNAGVLSLTVSTGLKGAFTVMKKRITSIKKPNTNNRCVLIICLIIMIITAGCSLVEYVSEESDGLSSVSVEEFSVDERLFGEWSGEAEGTEVVFRFWNNNTGSMTLTGYGYETTADYTYSADGTYLTIYGEGFDGNRGTYAVDGDLMTLLHNGALCLRRCDSIVNAPDVSSLSDGLYTVTMTSAIITDESGNKTCMFYPWTQYEVDQTFVDSLVTGQNLDLSGWGGYGIITIQDISTEAQEPTYYLGTNYTGLRRTFSTDTASFSFYQEEGSEMWKLFSSGYVPVMQQHEMMRMVIAEDCIIYDAYSLLHGDHPEMTSEEYEDVIQFRNTSLTEGVSDSITDFFEVFGYTQYDYTVIRVENNEVTEIYFWYV